MQVTVTGVPACTEVGLAEQDMVGGFFGGSFTVKFAVQLAVFALLHLGIGDVRSRPCSCRRPHPLVSMVAVLSLPVTFPPLPLQLIVSACAWD